ARAAGHVEDERRVRAEGAFRRGRPGRAPGVLVLLEDAAFGGACAHPRGAHRAACFRHLVEFPRGARAQQRPGVRVMTPPRSFPLSAVVFAAVYAVAYLICVDRNYALFTYHPAIYEWGLGVQKPKDGPAMYWFGWLATSGIVATIVAAV